MLCKMISEILCKMKMTMKHYCPEHEMQIR